MFTKILFKTQKFKPANLWPDFFIILIAYPENRLINSSSCIHSNESICTAQGMHSDSETKLKFEFLAKALHWDLCQWGLWSEIISPSFLERLSLKSWISHILSSVPCCSLFPHHLCTCCHQDLWFLANGHYSWWGTDGSKQSRPQLKGQILPRVKHLRPPPVLPTPLDTNKTGDFHRLVWRAPSWAGPASVPTATGRVCSPTAAGAAQS